MRARRKKHPHQAIARVSVPIVSLVEYFAKVLTKTSLKSLESRRSLSIDQPALGLISLGFHANDRDWESDRFCLEMLRTVTNLSRKRSLR